MCVYVESPPSWSRHVFCFSPERRNVLTRHPKAALLLRCNAIPSDPCCSWSCCYGMVGSWSEATGATVVLHWTAHVTAVAGCCTLEFCWLTRERFFLLLFKERSKMSFIPTPRPQLVVRAFADDITVMSSALCLQTLRTYKTIYTWNLMQLYIFFT